MSALQPGGSSPTAAPVARWYSVVSYLLTIAFAAVLLSCGSDSGVEPDPNPDPDPEPVSYFGPEIHVTSPARAGMLKTGSYEASTVDIAGTLCDSSQALLSFEFDGQDMGLSDASPCQSFSASTDCLCGLTILEGKLFNGLGQFGYLSQSFIRSPAFYPVATTADPAARVSTAVLAEIGQEFLDDGDRQDMDDLATVVEFALNEADLIETLGNDQLEDLIRGLTPEFELLELPMYLAEPDDNNDGKVDRKTYDCVLWDETNHETGYRIALTDILYDGISVHSLRFVQDGIEAVVRILRPRIEGTTSWYLDLECLGEKNDTDGLEIQVTQYVELRMTAKPRIEQVLGGGPNEQRLTCEFDDIQVDYKDLDIDLGLPGIFNDLADPIRDEILDLFVDAVEYLFKDYAMGMLEDFIAGMLDEKVEDFLGGFAPAADIELPPPLDETVVSFATNFDRLDFEPGRAQVGAYVQVYPETPDQAHLNKPYGTLKYQNTVPDLTGAGLYGMGLRDDLLNQFLWSAWLAGAMDLPSITELVSTPADITLHDGSVFASLPPVVMSDESGDGIRIGIGDVFVDFTLSMAGTPAPLHVGGYLSVMIGGELTIDPLANELDFGFDEEDMQISLQITEFESHALELRDPINMVLQMELQDRLPGMLAEIITRYPLPEINIGDFYDILPSVDIKILGAGLERQDNYSVLTGVVLDESQ